MVSVVKMLFVVALLVSTVNADSGDLVTPWTPYRGPTRQPPKFTVLDLFNLPKGEVAGGQYIRRCVTCDMPRLFKAFHRK